MNTNYIDTLPFSPAPPAVMYVDIDSCFATIEQQANPLLRHKPVAVAASKGDHGCILASSIEAKRLGIKTGTRVWEAKNICPSIIVLEPDSNKYRYVNRKLLAILERFQAHVKVRSIDEMSLMFSPDQATKTHLFSIGKIFKQRIAEEIGDYMSVTIGIGPNCSLAKLASNLGKPNGLKEITQHNYVETFTNLPVIELCGIGPGNTRRFRALDAITEKYGYFTVFPATMIGTETNIPDRIAFGSARKLETFSI